MEAGPFSRFKITSTCQSQQDNGCTRQDMWNMVAMAHLVAKYTVLPWRRMLMMNAVGMDGIVDSTCIASTA